MAAAHEGSSRGSAPGQFHVGRIKMKICIFGAGAIGSYLAVELALSGQDVCVVARGAHLRAIQERGLTLRIDGEEKHIRLPASDRPSDFGHQDHVFCALKAHQAYACAEDFLPLLGDDTTVVTAMNGIPWWYFYKDGSPFEGHHLASVDPGWRQWHTVGAHRAIGCVVDPACEIAEPGVVVHNQFKRFQIGEPDRSRSERVLELSAILTEAGFEAPVREDIRWNVWLKLWGNVCFNPISVLTEASLDKIVTDPHLRALCVLTMQEARRVASALQIDIGEHMIERRLTAVREAVGHKMSMLQDIERGRSLEIDALITSVQELGRMTGVNTPQVDLLHTLVEARGREAKLYEPLALSRDYAISP
jgi:2-dehydropantoate 2-reductase